MADLLCPVLIGRDAETARLRSAFAAVQGGAGGVMFLTGEAGIGKSRLASELAAEARAFGATVLAGRAVPTSASIPYRPLTEAVLQALRERAFPDDPGLRPWLPALRAVIPTIGGSEGDGLGDHAAPVRGEAVLQLLRRFAGGAGLLLVLEDLHWADPDTLAVVEYLSDNLSAEAVLCVATCRGETPSTGADLVARLTGRRAAQHLALGRLTAGQVAAMVRACLPSAPDEVIARVQRVADGIPFLVEESLAAPGVPRSFADGVRSRLAALSDDERLVLHTAALLGRQFDWRLLPAATGLEAGLVAGALEHGVGAQLLAVDADVFRFRHMLTREAVAAELLPPRRVTLAARTLAARAAVHLKLAHAAVDATRWAAARRQLAIAGDLAAETATLNAEVAFADNDIDQARALAESAMASPQASPQIRCHALELFGRILRGKDLDAARDAFEQALVTADAAGLAVWRLRALHQLGTIDMFDNARTDRLSQARRIADELGAASTGAVIDLQLTAVAMFRYELGEAEQHAQSALATSTRRRLAKTHAIGLLFLAEIQALRRDHAGMDRFLALAHAAEPGDPEIEGSALAGVHGMLALLDDDTAGALEGLGRGVAILDTLPQQGPAPYRAMWPLLLAANGDGDAAAAIGNARRIGLTINRVNRGILGYADAILAGRAGDQDQATELAVAADRELRHYPVWADLARLCAAEPALADGWGQPRQWLEIAAGAFARHGIEPLALRCRRLLEQPPPSRWSRLGITDRQADVLRLVAEGISNKEIAARLHLFPRTMEKHVESLLRKTAARSRTQLVAIAGPESPIDARQWRDPA